MGASRKEKLKKALHKRASKGFFSMTTKIYASEIRHLRRLGFVVEEVKPQIEDLILVRIFWSKPEPRDTNCFSYAEELKIIAIKAKRKKRN